MSACVECCSIQTTFFAMTSFCVCRNVKLGLVLLREAKRGPDSPWQLWIESLPHQVATLIHWSEKELQQLQMDITPTERQFLDQVGCVWCLHLTVTYTADCKLPGSLDRKHHMACGSIECGCDQHFHALHELCLHVKIWYQICMLRSGIKFAIKERSNCLRCLALPLPWCGGSSSHHVYHRLDHIL